MRNSSSVTWAPSAAPSPGLGANRALFLLLVATNAFVGGVVGLERSILPLLAEDEFGIASKTAAVSFIVTFGLAALAVLGAGTALVYPTLLAAIGDAVPPLERATTLGVYRFWRDTGAMAGALGPACSPISSASSPRSRWSRRSPSHRASSPVWRCESTQLTLRKRSD